MATPPLSPQVARGLASLSDNSTLTLRLPIERDAMFCAPGGGSVCALATRFGAAGLASIFDAALQRRFSLISMVPCLQDPPEGQPNPPNPLLLPYSDHESVLMRLSPLAEPARLELCRATALSPP